MGRAARGKQKQKQRKARRSGGNRQQRARGRGAAAASSAGNVWTPPRTPVVPRAAAMLHPAPLALLVRRGSLHGATFPGAGQDPEELGWGPFGLLPAVFLDAGIAVLEEAGVAPRRWIPASVLSSLREQYKVAPCPRTGEADMREWLTATLASAGYEAEQTDLLSAQTVRKVQF